MAGAGMRCVVCAAVVLGAWLAGGAGVAAAAPNANPLSATEGQQFSGQVGTVSSCRPGDTKASINWGDNTGSSTGTLTLTTGSICDISGTHTYAEEGHYATTITVTGVGAGTSTNTATVADAPLSLAAHILTGTAGAQTSGVLATLDDSGGRGPGSQYTVQINWGDGQTSPGTVGAGGSISGSHTYAAAGTYAPGLTVTDDGGASASATATASISQPSLPPCAASKLAPAPPFTPSGGNANARWVQAIYHDLLGRAPDSAALAYLTGELAQGATRTEVVSAVEGNPDRPVIVGSLYNEYLHRTPDPAELTYWTQFLATGGTDQQLSAALLGSAEYRTTRGGGTMPGFLGSLYCDLLRRAIGPAELEAWESAIADGTSPQQVASQVLSSPEYAGDLVDVLYLRFLRRVPSASERTLWTDQIQTGFTQEQLIAALVSSQEYFDDFSGGGATFVNPSITALGVIHITLRHPATLALRVLELLPAVQRGAIATATLKVGAPHTRLLGTVTLGHHRKGHVTIRWGRKLGRHRLKRGRYLLLLESRVGKKLTDVSNPIALRLR